MKKLLCLALVLCMAGVAHAGLITEGPLGYSLSLSPGSQTLSFNQFDTLGGTRTLTMVELSLSSTIEAFVEIENDSDIESQVSVSMTGNTSGSGPSGLSTLVLFNVTEGPETLAATDGVPRSGPDYWEVGMMSDSGVDSASITTDLSPYIGLGTVDIDIDGVGGHSFQGTTDATLWVSQFKTLGDATITYHYTEDNGNGVPIPEPTGLVLLGLAGLVRRRRRS